MGKYFYLQWKRVSKYLPGAIAIVLILFLGLLLAYSAMTSYAAGSDDNQRIRVSLCGDIDDPFMQMGLSAITALDSSRYSIEVLTMDEEAALRMLERGELAAYVVVPEGFMDSAMVGHLEPMTVVTSAGSSTLVSVFKDEITTMIADLVIECQRGVFGLMDGYDACDMPYDQAPVDELCFKYVEFILCRNEAYTLEELGIADALKFSEYLLCGLSVLLLLLFCLPFAPLMIRQDNALGRMLAAKGKPLWKQYMCSFCAYLLGLFTILLALLLAAVIGLAFADRDLFEELPVLSVLINAIPVILMSASLSYMLYSFSEDLISGVLLQFFSVAAMCFVSGCMYPVYFFPQKVQKLAGYLPTGFARTQLSGIFTGEFSWSSTFALLGFSIAFFAIGSLIRIRATRNGGR